MSNVGKYKKQFLTDCICFVLADSCYKNTKYVTNASLQMDGWFPGDSCVILK